MNVIEVCYDSSQESKLRKATKGSVGYDIAANDTVVIPPGKTVKVNTGTKVATPDNIYCVLAPRSSSADKQYVLANTLGYIDTDYRGYILMAIKNTGSSELIIYPGDYLCQLIFKERLTVAIKEVEKLSETSRGEGGFGSTDLV